MEIAIIAHDRKKELMVQFCIAYSGVLTRHHLCATATTAKYITESTGLNIYKYLAGDFGGKEQIALKISYNEIDSLFYFRDTNDERTFDYDDKELLRLCDHHNIPFATNLATAELLIRAIENGDLMWREYVNPIYAKRYN